MECLTAVGILLTGPPFSNLQMDRAPPLHWGKPEVGSAHKIMLDDRKPNARRLPEDSVARVAAEIRDLRPIGEALRGLGGCRAGKAGGIEGTAADSHIKPVGASYRAWGGI